ncbi:MULTISPECIES: helix-turn-helix domain-containing protein [Streptomyces]|uniref:DUF2690 domain-containing protein n=1 Tax=Streptomyces lonegramiae TaxID=3075524 RepID=A0ABU2XDB5_9ACTN|nr:DUF2690 domain-containing protein [Streptomyces sp. DSM 41529]MDT0543886.1 DUF2690 domain-containing protein [Streptomyces sp. DSM 41529]
MPRWRELPEELDPQVREFAGQLRRLVEQSELSLVAVADRTGYSKTSWERYLNGRLLPPQGAVVALAEATGTDVEHLSTLWELAERAWSRSELRHDVTMESIRVAQARAALGEPRAATPRVEPPRAELPHTELPRTEPLRADPLRAEPPRTEPEPPRGEPPRAEPPRTELPRTEAPRTEAPRAETSRAETSRSEAALRAVAARSVADPPLVSATPTVLPAPPDRPGPPRAGAPDGAGPSSQPPSPDRRRRRAPLFGAAAVGVALVTAGAVLLVNPGGHADERLKDPTPGRTTTTGPGLPSGVKCAGQECTGRDPEAMGCGGTYARTTASVTVGSAYVEVRYSKVCGAAWARITKGRPGDRLQVTAAVQGGVPARAENGKVNADGDAYTPMIAVGSSTGARGCATLTTGQRGCTAAATTGRTGAP